jgi:hypothetical protein
MNAQLVHIRGQPFKDSKVWATQDGGRIETIKEKLGRYLY